MRAQLIDEPALAAVSPRNIRQYLRMNDWKCVDDAPGPSRVWARSTEDGTYEIIAPHSVEKRDFVLRVADLLRTLSIAEDRSELDVWRDLVEVSFDVLYVRARSDAPAGMAPLRYAAVAFAAAQSLISASTASLEEPRLVLPSRRPKRTRDLMQQVMAGPTGAGSYIISVMVRIPPRITPEDDSVLFEDEAEPFERKATRYLCGALVAARDAAMGVLEADTGLDGFVGRETAGVSANLCEALVDLSGVDLSGVDSGGFDVRLAWSLDRPVKGIESRVSFNPETIPVFQEAARELRTRMPQEDVRIRGNVIRLHREGRHGSGEVTIAGSVIGDPSERLSRVTVDLADPDYESAIRAHESFADVEVGGSLIQHGTRMRLRNARSFEVMPSTNGG